MDESLAVALRYDDSLPAPIVTAKGRNEAAERLIDLAQRYGVPVESAPELAERLVVLDPESLIPEELYQPIARIFAFIMQIDEDTRG